MKVFNRISALLLSAGVVALLSAAPAMAKDKDGTACNLPDGSSGTIKSGQCAQAPQCIKGICVQDPPMVVMDFKDTKDGLNKIGYVDGIVSSTKGKEQVHVIWNRAGGVSHDPHDSSGGFGPALVDPKELGVELDPKTPANVNKRPLSIGDEVIMNQKLQAGQKSAVGAVTDNFVQGNHTKSLVSWDGQVAKVADSDKLGKSVPSIGQGKDRIAVGNRVYDATGTHEGTVTKLYDVANRGSVMWDNSPGVAMDNDIKNLRIVLAEEGGAASEGRNNPNNPPGGHDEQPADKKSGGGN